jgi:hypothetical protein
MTTSKTTSLTPAQIRKEINQLQKQVADLSRQVATINNHVPVVQDRPWMRIAATVAATFVLGRIVDRFRLGVAGATAVPMIAAQLGHRFSHSAPKARFLR